MESLFVDSFVKGIGKTTGGLVVLTAVAGLVGTFYGVSTPVKIKGKKKNKSTQCDFQEYESELSSIVNDNLEDSRVFKNLFATL
ncbi:hypothetical protein EB118_03540 [bacterium]|nr:hypothetical protein [bacterium]NDC94053.1 hypothetical protein [bacterium]NDD82739.1 hypothetical protein [bacterium]NDG29159.1 hypothetical protein [bacterium]